MKNLKITITLATIAVSCLAAMAQKVVMQPLASFGPNGDGTIRPNDYHFLTSSNQWQRGIAYNPVSGHLLVVDRSTNSLTSVNNDVYILDAATGAAITNLDGSFKRLDTSRIVAGGNASFTMNLIGVADDGAIYVANLSNQTGGDNPRYRLYRWADEDSQQAVVFPDITLGAGANHDPSNGDTNSFQKRWGDTLTVRGSGLDTQVLIANRGTLAALFTPANGSVDTFTPRTLTTDVTRGWMATGLSFGAGDTFWATSGPGTNGPLVRLQFDANAGTATTQALFPSTLFPSTMGPIAVFPSSNLLAGITMVSGADVVRLYDISDPSVAPVLLDRKSFATTHNNQAYGGSLTLGANGVLYALNADNGIMAFTLTDAASNPLPPLFFLQPGDQTVVVSNTVTLNAGADSSEAVDYQWFFGIHSLTDATTATLTITNAQLSNAGNYQVVASNSLGSVTSSVAIVTVLATPENSLLNYDPIPYAVNSQVATQGNWFSTAPTIATVQADSLSYSGLADSISNKITWGGGNMSLRMTNAATVTSGSIYFSYLYKLDPTSTVPAAGAAGGAVAGFVNGNTATYFAPKIVVRNNSATVANSYLIGAFKGGSETYGGFATNTVSLGETVLIVGRYTFRENSGTDDTIDLWINPDPSTFGASTAPQASVGESGVVTLAGTATTDMTQIDRFFFRSSSGPSRSYADEIRVGLEWADVTPVPSVAVAPQLSIQKTGTSVRIAWPSSATGYALEGTASLSTPNWSTISHSTVGQENVTTVNAENGNLFVRLKK